MLDEYAEEIQQAGGRLYLAGVDERLEALLRRVGKFDVGETVHIMREERVLGASTLRAVDDAEDWLGQWRPGERPADDR